MKQALADAIADRGYTQLTPVQEAVGAAEHEGRDLLVSAQTGSGKTLGFGIAIAPRLLGEAETFEEAAAPLGLVIAPTRELAMQVKRELAWLYARTGAVLASTVGGMDYRDERRALARGTHIVVATPGRLRDHIERGSVDLSSLRAVVLDEADEMLDLGFREDLEFILSQAPEERQTLLFSATVPASIAALAKGYQRDAVRVESRAETSQHADIDYLAMAVAERDHENAVINLLRYHEAPNAIVFCNTRATVSRLTSRLSNRGFRVVALSGELSQQERTNALQAMRDGRARVCVATDVAARGIDLPNLDLVVHAELPGSHETLLHRSGRTGRAGRKGTSALIVTPRVRKKALRVLGAAKLTARWAEPPSAEAVAARDWERMLESPDWQEPVSDSEAAPVAELVARFSPEQIAAAYMRLHATQHSAPEELSGEDPAPKPRAEFGPSAWVSIALGRNQQAEPRRLLPMLCKAGGLTKGDIGAIRIAGDESFIEIRQPSLKGFLDHLGKERKVEGAEVRQLDGPPEGLDRPPARRPAPRGDKPTRKEKPARPPRAPRPQSEAKAAPQAPVSPAPAPAPEPEAPHVPRQKERKPRAKAGGADATRHRPGAANPSASMKPGRNGPPPPKGKPSSKKNKARAEGRAEFGKGPDGPPRRSGKGPGKPGGKPFGKPGGKSFGKPGGKPTGKPTGKPHRGKS
ncbi:DEAD/DEAH box helicase [Oceanicola sp. D3]|uniref:DEAD/DEAH box helicase n=1 Tax=Oceanicola sp. D3 TaxID=2587163 RepID=UPI0011211BB8|nr:DEAD/DEAH box helicase [Oceanicola sp. D3]QDC09590.1 DEAD/DEAH box helicase [Oceanicola sp. D3]